MEDDGAEDVSTVTWYRAKRHVASKGTGLAGHVQVSQGGEPVAHASATFLDAHPIAVLEARIQQVTESLSLVEWVGDAVVGIGW